MSSKPKGSLSNAAIKEQQVELASASTVIQTYAQMILEQPNLELQALPELPAHQKAARDHVNMWNGTILPLMAKTDADIIDYANKFESFYEDLVKYAKNIEDPKSKKSLVEGLKLLWSTVKQKDTNAQTVVKMLTTFHENLNNDYQHFSKDVQDAEVKIEGDKGEIKALSDELDAIHDAMQKDIDLMAGGAVTMVVGSVMIVVGFVADIATAGLATGLIGGGVVVTIGGVAMEIVGSLDYSKKIDKQREVSEKLAEDKQELLGLKTAKTQVSGFVKGLKSAITAAASLSAAWQTLDADLHEVITAVNDVDPNITGPWLLDELDRAKRDWKVALDQAKRLQPDGKVPTQFYKNLQDAFKQMRKPGEM